MREKTMSKPNRQAAEQFILKYIQKLLPDGKNKALYEKMFSEMNDEQFESFMKALQSGETTLNLIAPNFQKVSLNLERNLKIAKELNYNFFQRIWMPATNNSPRYLTPIPYLVVELPVRRQAQLLVKKISIPEDNNTVDDFTGQPTGRSKGSKVSYPEVQILAAMGLEDTVTELMKYRGGDQKGFDAMNTMISRTGGVSTKAIAPFSSGVESTKTLKAILTAMHLSNTL